MAAERLQKILAGGGLASRRAAEQMIKDGRVRVNGRIVTELGSKADARNDKIEVDGKRVVHEHPVYFALHKPRGFVTTMSDPEGRPTIRDLLKPHAIPARVFPVGRLDFNTSGILLLTNDGEFSNGLLHPRRAVPKTYVVKVYGKMEPKHLDQWREGIELEDGKTLTAEAAILRFEQDKTWFQITIREGRNQQIRRMGEATGFRVMRLARVAFAGVTSDDIKPGDLRPLTYDELSQMKKDFGVPKKPAVARSPIPGWEHNKRAGIIARRSGNYLRDTRDARHDGEDDTPERTVAPRDARPSRDAKPSRNAKPSRARNAKPSRARNAKPSRKPKPSRDAKPTRSSAEPTRSSAEPKRDSRDRNAVTPRNAGSEAKRPRSSKGRPGSRRGP